MRSDLEGGGFITRSMHEISRDNNVGVTRMSLIGVLEVLSGLKALTKSRWFLSAEKALTLKHVYSCCGWSPGC
jgi:hypothetical protein